MEGESGCHSEARRGERGGERGAGKATHPRWGETHPRNGHTRVTHVRVDWLTHVRVDWLTHVGVDWLTHVGVDKAH